METRRAIIHFVDGTQMALEWPQQIPKGLFALESAVNKAIEATQLAIEADGRLLIIQRSSVKYIEVIPAPEKLPEGIIRGAKQLAQDSSA